MTRFQKFLLLWLFGVTAFIGCLLIAWADTYRSIPTLLASALETWYSCGLIGIITACKTEG